jgi:hypothetical protein
MDLEGRASFEFSPVTGHLQDRFNFDLHQSKMTDNERFILFISLVVSCIVTSNHDQLEDINHFTWTQHTQCLPYAIS